MSVYGKGKRGKATRLHAQVVRQRGVCENDTGNGPGHSPKLECAHIISRRYAATRCDPANAFCLCSACHRHFTAWPLEFHTFVIGKIGANGYDDLRAAAMSSPKTNDAFWQGWIDVLTPMLEDAA